MAKKIKKQGQPEQPKVELQDQPQNQDQPELNTPTPTGDDKKKSIIPKRNTKDEAPKVITREDVPGPNASATPSADAADRQLNTEEAVGYAMTTGDPIATAKRLAAQRKLKNVTAVLKKLEDLGHK